MNEIIKSGDVKTMSTIDLVTVINELREEGRSELRHDTFMHKVEKHPGITHQNFLASYKDSTGRTLKCYKLPKRETELMVMSESLAVQAKVYDRLTELEARAPTPIALSLAETFLQNAQLLVAIESRMAKTAEAQIALSIRLEAVASSAALLKCPVNAEPISHIRKRISKEFGLPVHIIDTVMRQLPCSPKLAGIVVNGHGGTKGAHYAIYWIKDVIAIFKLFVSECKRETYSFVTHPFIEYRFKLNA